jgi:TonB family protein
MKKALALLLFAAAPAFAADDAEIVKGLRNLATVHRLAAFAEVSRATGNTMVEVLDPWGTPYRIVVNEQGSLVASAGSDRKFDESVWTTREQFRGLEGDVVIANMKVMRTNRNWLHVNMPKNSADAQAALAELREKEAGFVMWYQPLVRDLMLRGATVEIFGRVAKTYAETEQVPEAQRDAWATPLRIELVNGKLRIISAGADRKFDPESWSRAPQPSVGEDIVFEDGEVTRLAERGAILEASDFAPPDTKEIGQPPDPRIEPKAGVLRVGGEVKAPVVAKRVEPVYPDQARMMRLSGIVILESLIDEQGVIHDVRVIKSLTPDFDMAAFDAVRQWSFEPATQDGKPVPVLFHITIHFKLK